MKISKELLKKIIAEELEGMQVLPEEETEEERAARIKTPRKSKMIDGVLYPLPLRMLYKLFGLDEGHDFREGFLDHIKHLLQKKKEGTIGPDEETELLDLLNRPELMGEGDENK
tara:strand:+ start:364 stop:705 length:342 start_codon:yes stop_codon:yes gene_type:complete